MAYSREGGRVAGRVSATLSIVPFMNLDTFKRFFITLLSSASYALPDRRAFRICCWI